MNSSRLQRFSDEHPEATIPWIEELSAEESATILNALYIRIPELHDDDGVLIEGIDPDLPTFSLEQFLEEQGIVPQEVVYLNYFERTIDQMHLCDLAKYFDSFYWVGPDDLQIFDDSFCWAMFIDHHGRIHIKSS
jgi:hypothetical protein